MRVIAGTLRGRTLHAPSGDATRPTSDRVRESLFSILGDLHGVAVLDLYAGTGALAIEAISRGAARAVCVESARQATAVLRKNIEALGLGDRVKLVARRVDEAGAALVASAPFDLVFADPPYADVPSGVLGRALHALLGKALLSTDARLVVEHASRDSSPKIERFVAEETRKWGDTSATFYARVASTG